MSEDNRRARRVRGEYTTYSYALLYNGVSIHLKHAEAQEAGSFYYRLSAMLLSAFSVEAHLNHIGPLLFEHWDDQVKRGTSVESKFKLIASYLQLPLDDYRRLNQALRQLTSFRNKVAHAETEKGSFEASVATSGHVATPGAKWEQVCTLGTAKHFAELAKDFMMTINRHAGRHEYELYIAGEGTHWDEI